MGVEIPNVSKPIEIISTYKSQTEEISDYKELYQIDLLLKQLYDLYSIISMGVIPIDFKSDTLNGKSREQFHQQFSFPQRFPKHKIANEIKEESFKEIDNHLVTSIYTLLSNFLNTFKWKIYQPLI